MNKAILMGRLTRDPDIRYSGQGQDAMCVAKFTVAIDRRKRANEEKEADFISCVAFGKTAEFCEKYIQQGTKVTLCGHIQTGSYTNKDNQKVYTTDVVVDEIEFAESKAASAGNAGNAQKPKELEQSEVGQGFLNIPDGVEDEGLPFN